MKLQRVEFSKSFSAADCVVVTPIYAASETPISDISQNTIAKEILVHSKKNNNDSVLMASSIEDAASLAVKAVQRKGPSLVITLGAGDIQNVGRMILAALKR